jgi:hypothetical protein
MAYCQIVENPDAGPEQFGQVQGTRPGDRTVSTRGAAAPDRRTSRRGLASDQRVGFRRSDGTLLRRAVPGGLP